MTIENVLTQSNRSRATLYKYFSNKHELVLAALTWRATTWHKEATSKAMHLAQKAPGMGMPPCAGDADKVTLHLETLAYVQLEQSYNWVSTNQSLCLRIMQEINDRESPVFHAGQAFIRMLTTYWLEQIARHGLTYRDELELIALLHIVKYLGTRFFSLPPTQRDEQRQRFIDATMTLFRSYLRLVSNATEQASPAGRPRSPG